MPRATCPSCGCCSATPAAPRSSEPCRVEWGMGPPSPESTAKTPDFTTSPSPPWRPASPSPLGGRTCSHESTALPLCSPLSHAASLTLSPRPRRWHQAVGSRAGGEADRTGTSRNPPWLSLLASAQGLVQQHPQGNLGRLGRPGRRVSALEG